MGDAGEGLVDADARIQERLEELEAAKRERAKEAVVDAEAVHRLKGLELARVAFMQQLGVATHPVRQEQLKAAIADIDRQIAKG